MMSYRVFRAGRLYKTVRYCSCEYCYFGSPYGMWLAALAPDGGEDA
jgi:hypothetical protein